MRQWQIICAPPTTSIQIRKPVKQVIHFNHNTHTQTQHVEAHANKSEKYMKNACRISKLCCASSQSENVEWKCCWRQEKRKNNQQENQQGKQKNDKMATDNEDSARNKSKSSTWNEIIKLKLKKTFTKHRFWFSLCFFDFLSIHRTLIYPDQARPRHDNLSLLKGMTQNFIKAKFVDTTWARHGLGCWVRFHSL